VVESVVSKLFLYLQKKFNEGISCFLLETCNIILIVKSFPIGVKKVLSNPPMANLRNYK